MKNKIYIVMESVYSLEEDCWYDELRGGGKFFKNRQEAMNYVIKTIYPEHKDDIEEWLIEDYYDNRRIELFEEEEKANLPHYQPAEEEILKNFKDSDYYKIIELEEF